MKIYTRTGDRGETGLFRGPRVPKDDARIEAYGTVDELNALLGVVRAERVAGEMDALLARTQHELFALGAELATPDPAARGTELIGEGHITALEAAIDQYEPALAPLKDFILPAGAKAAAALHVARAVCRRAERRVVTLFRSPGANVSARAIRYLNRLGDLLFVLARAANAAGGCRDVTWQKPEVDGESEE